MMSVEAKPEYVPGDPILIRDIISQLKSQGVFDQFRKECISDVDTKPAYQNLCHRVDGQVSSYLSDIRWGPDLNKNQLRENIRKFVNKCTFVEPGISRIVDQLVNPRINTVLVPKVEDIVYQYVGIPPIERNLPKESDSNENPKFDGQDSSFEKSWSSSSSFKHEPSWLRSPSNKFDNYVHSKMDSSSSLPSLFDLKVEPPDEMKEKNDDSRTDFFHPEGGDEDNSRAYSTIDSDEDNLNDDVEEPSPSFEAFDLPDTCNSASVDSDYPAEVADSRDDGPPGLEDDAKSTSFGAEPNDENTNVDSVDDRSTQVLEAAPAQFEVPKTPTINYETSEDSDDQNGAKMNDALEVNPEHGSVADDIPDFSSVDKIAEKIAEDNREQEKIVSGDDEASLKNGDCSRPIAVDSKPKEDKSEKHPKEGEKEGKADGGAKESKHRKYSEHRKDKHKSDKRDSSRDDREHKHREKERSNRDSSRSKSSKSRTESRDKTRKSSDEKEPAEDEASAKSKSKDEHRRSRDDRKSRDKEKQKSSLSGERRSKDDKCREKRSKSDDGREERKKSRHDRDRSKDLKKSTEEKVKKADGESKEAKKHAEDEKVKVKKAEGAEKKSGKSQCGADEKKARTDRRSSDRDSNGPSSSHHRSASKSDRERHADKSRHSSTSHKSKKSDGNKSVSSDRHAEDGCENSAHHKKRKEEKVADPKEPVGGLDSKGQEDAKPKEPAREKRKDSRGTCEPPKESAAADSQRLDEATISKSSARPNPPKRSLVEMNSKEATAHSNELPSQNLPLKMAANDFSPFNIKKPKIARNESEFGKVVRLRKEYKERMRLLQQQGKENSESRPEDDEKRIMERLSPAPAAKEPKVVSNGSKNGLIKDLKLSITRVDACYKIVDGSCLVNEAVSHDIAETPPAPEIPEIGLKTPRVHIKPISDEKHDKLMKLKICRSISPTSGKERTKCVRSSYENDDAKPTGGETKCVPSREIENTKSNPTRECTNILVDENEDPKWPIHEIDPHPAAGVDGPATNPAESVFYPFSENEDDVEEEVLNEEDLLRQMNIEEIIGCRTDCTRISYDAGEKNVCEVVETKEPVADAVPFDEDNKENVGAERCTNEAVNCAPKGSPEVLYFEPASPTNEFTKYVRKLIRDSEDVSLPNFSIQLDYPKEYDAIFRSQLGASVSRVDGFASGHVDSASTGLSSLTLPEARADAAHSEALTNELKPSNEFSGILSAAADGKCDSSHDDQLVRVQKVKLANSTKRKTLGIKRRISSVSGAVCGTPNASGELATESLAARLCHPAENNAKKRSPEMCATLATETSCLKTHTGESTSVTAVALSRLPATVEEDEKKRIYSSFNNNVPESTSYPIPAKTPKKPRKTSPVRSSDEILTEIVPKRTPYKNKCYYDSSDLYKPRPSFLASSRRSRALNPDTK